MAKRDNDSPDVTLDDDVSKPSSSAPGAGPADTLDPDERATSATPDKAAAAQAGHGTVNAVKPLPKPDQPQDDGEARTETYEATAPDGSRVKVTRNVETGESSTS